MMPNFDMNLGVPPYIPIEKLIASGDFTYDSLAGCVNSYPYEPAYLGDKNIYAYQGLMTRNIKVEFDGQTISLIQSSAPESPGVIVTRKGRKSALLTAPRLAATFTVRPDEVAEIREMGGAELETVETDATIKARNAIRNIRSTWEYQRVCAAQGILLDADQSTIVNYFDLLGVSQPTYDMTFGTTSTSLLNKFGGLLNEIEDALVGLSNSENLPGAIVPDDPPLVLCGRTFWQKLMQDSTFETAFGYFQSRDQRYVPTREDLRYREFEFGGFILRQYRGQVNGYRFVPDANAYVLHQSLPGTYLGYCTPPEDDLNAVNKRGLPITATAQVLPHNSGIEFRLQSNIVHINTRPSAAFQLFSSN